MFKTFRILKFSLSLLFAIGPLLGCESRYTAPVEEKYLSLAGGAMHGDLTINKSLMVGETEFRSVDQKLGVGTDSPSSYFTVAGLVESTVDGFKFPDGTVQATAAAGGCFGGICAGDTQFSGRSTFTANPLGGGVNQASLSVNPSSSSPNDLILGVGVLGAPRFSVDAEGDVAISGNLLVSGVTSFSNLNCTSCVGGAAIADASISSADIVNESIESSDIRDLSITGTDIANATITADKIGGTASSGYTLGKNSLNQTVWLPPQIQYGLRFVYSTASALQLVPSGINGRASVLISNGTDLRSVVLTAALTADLGITGAGGLDVGLEASNTGYDVYVITEDDGVNPSLLLTASGATPNLPGSYTYISEVLWFVSNSSGVGQDEIANFLDLGHGSCQYLVDNGLSILNGGSSTTLTAVDFSSYIPSQAVLTSVQAIVANTGINNIDLELYLDAGATQGLGSVLDLATGLTGASATKISQLSIPIRGSLLDPIYYRFSAASVLGSVNLSLSATSWVLPRRMSP